MPLAGDLLPPPPPLSLQSFPASGSLPVSWLFASGGHIIGTSTSASVLPMNIHGWFPLGLIGLILSQGNLKSLLQPYNSKASILWPSAFFMVRLSHLHVTTGKTMALTIWTFVSKMMPLLYNTLSRFAIAFLPRSKYLLISWLQSPSAVTLEPKKIKSIPLCPLLLAMKWWIRMPWSFFNVQFLICFSILFHPHQEVLLFCFSFCH